MLRSVLLGYGDDVYNSVTFCGVKVKCGVGIVRCRIVGLCRGEVWSSLVKQCFGMVPYDLAV